MEHRRDIQTIHYSCSRRLVRNDNPSRTSYIELLICCMGKTRPSRVRHAAVRTTLSDRAEPVASITSDLVPLGVGARILHGLHHTLFIQPHFQRINWSTHSETVDFTHQRTFTFITLEPPLAFPFLFTTTPSGSSSLEARDFMRLLLMTLDLQLDTVHQDEIPPDSESVNRDDL